VIAAKNQLAPGRTRRERRRDLFRFIVPLFEANIPKETNPPDYISKATPYEPSKN
jgi:hypothetical protein